MITISPYVISVCGFFTQTNDGVESTRTNAIYVSERHENIDHLKMMLKSMGFKNRKEYINAYPGQFTTKSAIVRTFGKYGKVSNFWRPKQVNAWGLKYDIYSRKEELQDKLNLQYPNVELMIVPTIEEVRSCNAYHDVDNNELWFCSDWSET